MIYVGHVVKHASATNGVFAFVLGLMAFLYLTPSASCCASKSMSSASTGCIRVRCSHRSPTTSTLTAGDRRAYTDQAEAQRMKGFQDVDVSFDDPGRDPGGT